MRVNIDNQIGFLRKDVPMKLNQLAQFSLVMKVNFTTNFLKTYFRTECYTVFRCHIRENV